MCEEEDAIINRVLSNSVAESIKENVIEYPKFRKPMDSAAYRLANEYVIQYLFSHFMDVTVDVADQESSSYVHERHNPTWIARRLRIDENEKFFRQLVDSVHNDSTTDTSSSYSTEDEESYGKLPKMPTKSRGISSGRNSKPYRGSQLLQSSDDDLFTNMMSSGAEETEEKEEHHHSKPLFTVLEDDIDNKKAKKKASSRLYPKKSVKETKTKSKKFANKEKNGLETFIDTQY